MRCSFCLFGVSESGSKVNKINAQESNDCSRSSAGYVYVLTAE